MLLNLGNLIVLGTGNIATVTLFSLGNLIVFGTGNIATVTLFLSPQFHVSLPLCILNVFRDNVNLRSTNPGLSRRFRDSWSLCMLSIETFGLQLLGLEVPSCE